MAKGKQPRNPERSAERKLAEAQAKLHSAQIKRSVAMTKGEQDVEIARHLAAAAIEKATREVERRAGKVARAEARLAASRNARVATQNVVKPTHTETSAPPLSNTDELEILTSQVHVSDDDESLQPVDDSGRANENGLSHQERGSTEERLLASLRRHDAGGATFTEWLADSGMSKKTFLRARQVAVDHGLVERDGDGRGARYRISSEMNTDSNEDTSSID